MQDLEASKAAAVPSASAWSQDLTALKESMAGQNAQHMGLLTQQLTQHLSALGNTLTQPLLQELSGLRATVESQKAGQQAVMAQLQKAASAEGEALRTAMTQQAAEFAAIKLSLEQQLEELKLMQGLQHEDLVAVRAALHAVCAQCEAFKSTPAAVAKHVQNALHNDQADGRVALHGICAQCEALKSPLTALAEQGQTVSLMPDASVAAGLGDKMMLAKKSQGGHGIRKKVSCRKHSG